MSKPDGGSRELGIPMVTDQLIQQAGKVVIFVRRSFNRFGVAKGLN